MNDKDDDKRYRTYLDGELQAAAVYGALAESDTDPERAEVFRRLAQAEMRHASRWAQKLGIDTASLKLPKLSLRQRLLKWATKIFGTTRILPLLLPRLLFQK